MNNLKVAIVGAGIYGKHHINAYLHNPDVELVAVCDNSVERCHAAANELGIPGYASLSALLDKQQVDIISVATSDPFHKEPALQTIAQGKHVLIEKPLATSVADCEAIIAAAVAHGVTVGVDFHKRWDPAALRVRTEVQKVESGKILRGYINMDDVIAVLTEWLTWSAQSSPVWFLGSHCFDLARYISGQEVKSVYAVGQKRLLASKGLDTWDSVQSTLLMEDGSSWVIENSWVLPAAFPKDNDGRMAVLCKNAWIRSDSQNRGLEIFGQQTVKTPNSYFITYRDGVASGFGIDPINDFIKAVKTHTPYAASADDGLQASRICETAHKSLQSGQVELLV
ncbi:Gfo/Idh/MocA family protein [Raoultella terrigena]|uniref:Gfo/Idh/MocA family protein n=1 Tax=Raoultella terrigena TaxID=577 RepID=UPI0011D222AC|nr:Gfo/Idh/MocA family oxidoreductase [Raoultella terrigena]